jgi:hypothetical protein
MNAETQRRREDHGRIAFESRAIFANGENRRTLTLTLSLSTGRGDQTPRMCAEPVLFFCPARIAALDKPACYNGLLFNEGSLICR